MGKDSLVPILIIAGIFILSGGYFSVFQLDQYHQGSPSSGMYVDCEVSRPGGQIIFYHECMKFEPADGSASYWAFCPNIVAYKYYTSATAAGTFDYPTWLDLVYAGMPEGTGSEGNLGGGIKTYQNGYVSAWEGADAIANCPDPYSVVSAYGRDVLDRQEYYVPVAVTTTITTTTTIPGIVPPSFGFLDRLFTDIFSFFKRMFGLV